jgi:hypothetical protein
MHSLSDNSAAASFDSSFSVVTAIPVVDSAASTYSADSSSSYMVSSFSFKDDREDLVDLGDASPGETASASSISSRWRSEGELDLWFGNDLERAWRSRGLSTADALKGELPDLATSDGEGTTIKLRGRTL